MLLGKESANNLPTTLHGSRIHCLNKNKSFMQSGKSYILKKKEFQVLVSALVFFLAVVSQMK